MARSLPFLLISIPLLALGGATQAQDCNDNGIPDARELGLVQAEQEISTVEGDFEVFLALKKVWHWAHPD